MPERSIGMLRYDWRNTSKDLDPRLCGDDDIPTHSILKRAKKQTRGKTISRILWPALARRPMSIPLDPLSRTGSSCLPESRNRAGRASWFPYLALHRIRHSRQALSPRLPVVSYTTISPLPGTKKLRSLNGNQKGACQAVCFCGAAPHCCGFPLGSIPPCGVRTFLCSETGTADIWFSRGSVNNVSAAGKIVKVKTRQSQNHGCGWGMFCMQQSTDRGLTEASAETLVITQLPRTGQKDLTTRISSELLPTSTLRR